MATKAVFLIGGSGFVGTHLALRLREQYKVFATYHAHPVRIPGVTFFPVDVTNRNWVKRVVYTVRPDVVIYAAGRNDALWSENNARETENLHTGGAGSVCNVAEIFQPKFIFLSNCYTFDGTRGNYHETDTVLPTTALGKAKVGGENFIRGKALNYVIIRSSPVFGRGNGSNLSVLDRLRMRLDRGERIEVLDDEVHSYAPVDGLADLVAQVAESGLRNKVLHYGGLTKVSQARFALEFAHRFKYDPGLIVVKKRYSKSASAYELPQSDYSMNSTQAVESLKIKPLLLEEGFDLIEKKLITRL